MSHATRWVRRAAIAIAILLLAGYAVGSLGDADPLASSDATGLAGASSATDRAKSIEYGALGPQSADALGAPEVATEADEAIPDDGATFGDRVIRSTRMTVEVPEGELDEAWAKAMVIAAEVGGEVVGSHRGTEDPFLAERPTPIGTITIRVPADRLDSAARRFRTSLGEVRHESTDAQDVSQEFIDLKSRLRNLRAEESALLDLFARARSVRDTLAVRERLSQVRGEIEQAAGRLRFIESRTAFSTLALTLAEPGIFTGPPAGDDPSFARAWETALEGLVRMGTATMIALLWLAPFAALAAVVLGLRRRHAAAPPA